MNQPSSMHAIHRFHTYDYILLSKRRCTPKQNPHVAPKCYLYTFTRSKTLGKFDGNGTKTVWSINSVTPRGPSSILRTWIYNAGHPRRCWPSDLDVRSWLRSVRIWLRSVRIGVAGVWIIALRSHAAQRPAGPKLRTIVQGNSSWATDQTNMLRKNIVSFHLYNFMHS